MFDGFCCQAFPPQETVFPALPNKFSLVGYGDGIPKQCCLSAAV